MNKARVKPLGKANFFCFTKIKVFNPCFFVNGVKTPSMSVSQSIRPYLKVIMLLPT